MWRARATTRGRQAEFMVVGDGITLTVPLEVKSTGNVRLSVLAVYHGEYRLTHVVRVSARIFGPGEVEIVPLYAAWCLAEDVSGMAGLVTAAV